MVVDRSGGRHIFGSVSPDILKQVFAPDDFTAFAPKILKNLKFAGGHFERHIVFGRFESFEVDSNAVKFNDVLSGWLRLWNDGAAGTGSSAEKCFGSGEQF